MTRKPRPDTPAKAPAPAPLALTDDSHLVGTARMAELAGVSDQTLYVWEAEGRLAALGIVTRHAGHRQWDHKALLAWREKHRPVNGQIHGGARDGAGRKPAANRNKPRTTERRESPGAATTHPAPGDSSTSTTSTQTPTPLQAARPGALAHTPAPGRPAEDDDDDLSLFTAADRDLTELMEAELGDVAGTLAVARSGKISAAEALTAVKLQEAMRKMIDNRERLGQLVDAQQVATMMTQALQKVRETLDTFPDRMAAELAARLSLSPTQMTQTREMAHTEVQRMCGLLKNAMERGTESKQTPSLVA